MQMDLRTCEHAQVMATMRRCWWRSQGHARWWAGSWFRFAVEHIPAQKSAALARRSCDYSYATIIIVCTNEPFYLVGYRHYRLVRIRKLCQAICGLMVIAVRKPPIIAPITPHDTISCPVMYSPAIEVCTDSHSYSVSAAVTRRMCQKRNGRYQV